METENQENLIYKDDLTGFYNRRYLYSWLPKKIQEIQSRKSKLWLFMLDIDFFKKINDTYGHLSGDEIIKDVSVILGENVKLEDIRVRYAGDEFTIIIADAEATDVISIAERLVAKIACHRFKEIHSGKEIHLTVSVGIAGCPQDTLNHIELINLADKALYISKQKGKNCISTVSEITPDSFWKKSFLERFPCQVFSGRSAEISRLNECLALSVESNALLVLASGELGVGKSRFLTEFERTIRTLEILSLSVHCADKHFNQAFYAVGELLDAYFSDKDEVPQEFLADIADNELAELCTFLPVLKNNLKGRQVIEKACGEKNDLSEALIKLLINMSKYKPLCITIDDMQYIDKQSLEIILCLIQEHPQLRILVAGTFSPAELSIPKIGESALGAIMKTVAFKKIVQNIELQNLNEDGVNEMVSAIFLNVTLSTGFVNLIYKKTQGNPLFVEELSKYLIEKEFIYYREGKWLKKDISDGLLPGSVEDVIKSRIADLDDESKEMILKAAVIGEDFQVDLLRKIDSQDRGYVVDLIESAKKIGLVLEKGNQGNDEFSFATGAIRNILFKAIGGERVKNIYSRVGQIKESLYPGKLDAIAGELYYNFKKAEDVARADQYAKMAKEGKNALYDRTMKYAQTLLEDASRDKMVLPLSKKAWSIIPGLIKNLYMAGVNYALYPPQSKMRTQSIEEIFRKVSDILQETNILTIAVVEANIVVNNKRVGKELPGFFAQSFVPSMNNLNIESITVHKGVTLQELTVLVGIISAPEPPEEGISEVLKRQKTAHVQINEITYNVAHQKSKEKEGLQELMLIDYLMGKMQPDENKIDLSAALSDHAPEIARALEQLGEQASKDSVGDKEAIKADVMAKSLQQIGSQFSGGGADWEKYKEGMLKTILSIDPALRAKIFLNQETFLEAGDTKFDIFKELNPELPDNIIIEVIKNYYAQPDTDIRKMKNMIGRFLSSPGKKELLLPRIKEELRQAGATKEECDWMLHDISWDELTLDDKLRYIVETPVKTLIRLLPVIKIGPVIKELLFLEQDKPVNAVENKFLKIFEDVEINSGIFVNHFADILGIYLKDSPEKRFPKFLGNLVDLAFKHRVRVSAFTLIAANVLVESVKRFIHTDRITLVKQVLQVYAQDTQAPAPFSNNLESVHAFLVEELMSKIDANSSLEDLLEVLMVFRERSAKLLIDKALCETGVPQGKYFEAYLHRRTIGRVLNLLINENVVDQYMKEKLTNSPVYIIKNLMELIGTMENEYAVKMMRLPLAHADQGIRRKAVFTLGKMKGMESAEILRETLRDPDPVIAREALQALKNRKDPAAAQVLKFASQDKDLPADIRKEL
jgi:diguanylate cyclase (GGDEF)-like protein